MKEEPKMPEFDNSIVSYPALKEGSFLVEKIKPEPTDRARSVFQDACNSENMDAKFGKTLLKEHNAVRRFILTQSPVLGRIPAISEIGKAFPQFSPEEVDAILSELDRLDVIHLSKDKSLIAAAYPFSGFKTVHLVTLKERGYKSIYAMCAIDALGISFMLDCDLSINSRCHHCSESIRIKIQNNEIISLKPENIVVWGDMEYYDCAATSLCRNINFFSSDSHFAEWQQIQSKRKGKLLQIEEALYLGKLFFENRLKF